MLLAILTSTTQVSTVQEELVKVEYLKLIIQLIATILPMGILVFTYFKDKSKSKHEFKRQHVTSLCEEYVSLAHMILANVFIWEQEETVSNMSRLRTLEAKLILWNQDMFALDTQEVRLQLNDLFNFNQKNSRFNNIPPELKTKIDNTNTNIETLVVKMSKYINTL